MPNLNLVALFTNRFLILPAPNIHSSGARPTGCPYFKFTGARPLNVSLGVECSKKKRTVRAMKETLAAHAAYHETPGTESGLRRHALSDSAMTLRVANDCGDSEPTPNIRSTGAASNCKITVSERRGPVNSSLGVYANVLTNNGKPRQEVIMNRCAVAILRILLIAAAALTESVLCQTPTPTTIPKLAAMPREVREEVDRLASNDAGKRATGAVSLGQMGAAATQAIPYLVPLLGDSTEIWSIPLGKTTVSHIAGYALVQIGAKGTEVLISQLKRENQNDMYMRNVAATVSSQRAQKVEGCCVAFIAVARVW